MTVLGLTILVMAGASAGFLFAFRRWVKRLSTEVMDLA